VARPVQKRATRCSLVRGMDEARAPGSVGTDAIVEKANPRIFALQAIVCAVVSWGQPGILLRANPAGACRPGRPGSPLLRAFPHLFQGVATPEEKPVSKSMGNGCEQHLVSAGASYFLGGALQLGWLSGCSHHHGGIAFHLLPGATA